MIHNAYGDRRKNEVLQDTWGHLKPSGDYYGKMLVALGTYGDLILLNWTFARLNASPWQFDDFMNFLSQPHEEIDFRKYQWGVFEWTGLDRDWETNIFP